MEIIRCNEKPLASVLAAGIFLLGTLGSTGETQERHRVSLLGLSWKEDTPARLNLITTHTYTLDITSIGWSGIF